MPSKVELLKEWIAFSHGCLRVNQIGNAWKAALDGRNPLSSKPWATVWVSATGSSREEAITNLTKTEEVTLLLTEFKSHASLGGSRGVCVGDIGAQGTEGE